MANFLFKLGRGSARHPIVVIVSWLLALGIAGGAFVAFGGTLTDSFSIPGTETERVTDQLSDEIDDLSGSTAGVVFETEDGSALTASQQSQITSALASTDGIDHVSGVLDPFATEAERETQMAQIDAGGQQVESGQAELDAAIAQAESDGTYDAAADQFAQQQSDIDATTQQLDLGVELAQYAQDISSVSSDGSAALGGVHLDTSAFDLEQSVKDDILATVSSAPLDGVNVYFSSELTTSVEGILGVGEIVGVALALIVLIVMMRAILPALSPILTSTVGVGVGVATALAFSGTVEMSSVTPVLGVMLGLAVGIDYALFIINRHRKQLHAGMPLHESIGLANGTSGNAVVFAGTTVLIALLALNVTGVPFLGIMGTVAAFCVLIAVVNAVTLTPAVLSLMGDRAVGRKARASIGTPDAAEAAVKPMRTGRAVLAAVAAVVVLGIIAIPSASMRLGLPDGTQEPVESSQYQAYSTIDSEFGEGLNGTLLVTADLPDSLADEEVLAAQVSIESQLMAQDDVVAVAPAGVSADNSFLAFQVVPAEGPSSESTELLVHDLRDMSPLEDGTQIGVAGQASGNIDVSEKLAEALPFYLAVVVGLSLIILIIVFRSLLVPIMATGGFVLSLFAAFGAVTAVYQWGWLGSLFGVHDPGPVLSFLPIMLTGILFGLAMDYQLFLTTGMREAYVHGAKAREAVVIGRRHGRAVVTAAAIIMASVFGGFIFSEISMIRPMGFGLAIGVLFDAFIVRMVLLPALMHLVGEKAWWLPNWLEKILPNVDVEGAALEREHHG
ncbi:MMPL family transporter [Demequina aurantiaca]|uniref:MMPL family transporter n=1 Tax=Demequina aurantiaca TaxID=676200 RepID=UPI003D33511D